MPLSFQESRTPFSKRLEMLRRGISTSGNKLPSVMTPNNNTSMNGEDEIVQDKIISNNSTNKNQKRESKINVKMRKLAERENLMSSEGENVLENKPSIEENETPQNSTESKKYSGKRLYIAEDNDSDKESYSNKRTRLNSSEDSDVPPYSSFIPIGPIPTILGQSSEEEKSNAKLTNATSRRTRSKRKTAK